MSFRKLRGVKLPEEKQMLIRSICLTAAEQPKWVQKKISRLCDQQGGSYSAALREVMCSWKSITAIAMAHHVSEAVLYEARRRFYESW